MSRRTCTPCTVRGRMGALATEVVILHKALELRVGRHHYIAPHLPCLQHFPRFLCYDEAHVHTGPGPGKEETGWTLLRLWIR